MPINPLPAAPNKSTDTKYEFDVKADALVAALGDFVTEANALETNVNGKEAAAAASAAAALGSEGAAAASAASAIAAPGTSATSATSMSVGTGTKDLTIETGKDLVVGMKVIIASSAAPSTYMYGTITAYDSGTGALQVSVEQTAGSGTAAAWTVSLTGPRALALGDGQTWTNVKASRSLGVTYTNTTGRSIMVMATILEISPSIAGVTVLIDGSLMASWYSDNNGTDIAPISFIVPAGSSYRINTSGGCSVEQWSELR